MNRNNFEPLIKDMKKLKKDYGTLYPQNFLISLMDHSKPSIDISKEDYKYFQDILVSNKTEFIKDKQTGLFYTTFIYESREDGTDKYKLINIKI